ncbi:MAG: class I SAM-dependent methyltransferase [Candidatus Scalindua sp.]
MDSIESPERSFIGNYKLTRNQLHSGWESLASFLSRGKGICLDIGCGDGRHSEDIRDKGYKWIGCDIKGQRPKNFVLADALCLPFKSDSIEVVFSNCALEHMKDPFVAMCEIARVLKPKGRVYLLVAFMEPFHGSYFHITHWGVGRAGKPKQAEDNPNGAWCHYFCSDMEAIV